MIQTIMKFHLREILSYSNKKRKAVEMREIKETHHNKAYFCTEESKESERAFLRSSTAGCESGYSTINENN
jgi:hypothetical protein